MQRFYKQLGIQLDQPPISKHLSGKGKAYFIGDSTRTKGVAVRYKLSRPGTQKAAELGIDEIVDGLNLDDLHDYRPGMQAASEKRVRHPLVEAEMTKADIRALSRSMGLPTWDRPASPCLSSRFPYGTQITPAGLEKVAAGEKLLHSMGFAVARVRYHGDVARLELEQSEMARVFEPELRETVDREFKKIGFRFVAIDLKGFRSGSLNEGVIAKSPGPGDPIRPPRDQA